MATALAAAATLAIAPTMAAAAPGALTDDSTADFSQGAVGSATALADPGSVQLKRSIVTENFDGPGLPGAGSPVDPLTVTPWDVTGTATVGSGALAVNGALVKQNRTYAPGQVMEFTATFGAEHLEHIGFAADLNDSNAPYAIISTGGGAATLFARTFDGTNPETSTALPVSAGTPHTFRVEWSSNKVDYYVDGVLQHSDPLTIATAMSPTVSDASSATADEISLDSLGLALYPASATFESRVLDARDATATWGSLTSMVTGSDVTFKTRSGNTATPDGTWSAWADTVANAIQSPSARYIQYQATLSTADNRLTPSLDRVQIGYDDAAAPSTSIDGAQVVGTTARLAFSSSAADVDHFECSLDGGSFAACSSPAAFSGLAPGAHTVAVHAVDAVGNTGAPVSQPFSIDGPPATSSGTTASGSGAQTASNSGTTPKATDTTAPRVTLVVQSLRASKRGTIGVRVSCPKTEVRCTITVALKRGKTVVAHKTVTVAGGKSAKVTLQLSKAARKQLGKAHTLKVSAVTTARDAAGNKKQSTKALTLRAPAA